MTLDGRRRGALVEAVVSEIAGLGPLDALLEDAEVTEIMVNGPSQIYVERHGRLTKTGLAFEDEAHLRRIIERIVAPLGRRIDEASPMVDARLPDGSRVNCHHPAPGRSRPGADHPQVRPGPLRHGGPDPLRHADPADGGVSEGLRRRPPEHPGVGGHGQRARRRR